MEYLVEQLEALGAVHARRMFGGYGLFLETLMFGIVADDTLYLKADDTNRPDFEAAGLGPFTYTRQGKVAALSYFQAPDETVDDRDALCRWARGAFAVAQRAAAKKTAKKRRRPSRTSGRKKRP